MDPSKLYVPDPQKWVKFYKNLADEKINLFSTNQIGGGPSSFVASIVKYGDHLTTESAPPSKPAVKLVSSTEQIVDQAKSELTREGKD